MKDNMARYSLRVSYEMLAKMEYISEYEGRTKNKQIERVIREYIKNFEAEHGQIDLTDPTK